MDIRKSLAGLLAATFAFSAASVEAHHSHASLNMDDVRTYSGVVTRYSWTMPHVFIKVKGPDESGNIVEYSIELQHPPAMAKVGWSKTSFKAGDRITWEGPHDRDPGRHYTGLTWAERGDGTRFNFDEKALGEIKPSTDFTGLWKRSDVGGFKPHYRPPEGWPLTAKGQAMVDAFKEDQNPMVTCGNPGPPKSMIVPYPVMITRPDDKTFIFERELMSEVRVVHLDRDHAPGEPSSLGHSTAWFDGDDLVVETTHFVADPWGTHTGIDSSDQKHLVERFSLSEDGLYLTAEITVTDPVFLAEPVTFSHRWVKLADREVIQAPCTMEAAQLYLEAGYNDAR
jgi:hypothetical protein